MEPLFFLLPWLLIGAAVVFIAFFGGPGRARQAYLTRGNRPFQALILLVYLAFGIAIPVFVISNREQAVGGTGALANEDIGGRLERGKELFMDTCASCHSLRAANARGITGPSLDDIGAVNERRILEAIKNGGTGQNRMPKGLLDGENARAVAAYVTRVAGR